MNPFNLHGGAFLALYFAVVVIAFALALWARRALRSPADPPIEQPNLHPYETAHLAGGATLAVNAAITHLVDSDVLKFDSATNKLSRSTNELRKPHPLEQGIFNTTISDTSLLTVRTAVAGETAQMRQRLEQLGLEVPAERSLGIRFWPTVFLLAVALFGTIKIAVGLSRDKPVAFLVVACVATVVTAIILACVPVHRTRRGDLVLAELKQRHAALQTTAGSAPGTLHGHDLALAIGLFGMGVLAAGPLAALHRGLTPPASLSGGGDVGGGCGGGCGGGGGGGCGGGGGGGGCGGCGGGGGD
jgi:uncharacterized protein (TIGR04222 family)